MTGDHGSQIRGSGVYVEKTERLFRKAGKALESVADGIGRLSKRLGIVGLGLSVYDAYNDLKNNGVNWKPITKAVIGVGLGVLAAIPAITALAPYVAAIAIAGFAYGVLEYFGAVDYTLNRIADFGRSASGFFKDAWNETKLGWNKL